MVKSTRHQEHFRGSFIFHSMAHIPLDVDVLFPISNASGKIKSLNYLSDMKASIMYYVRRINPKLCKHLWKYLYNPQQNGVPVHEFQLLYINLTETGSSAYEILFWRVFCFNGNSSVSTESSGSIMHHTAVIIRRAKWINLSINEAVNCEESEKKLYLE